MTNEVVTGVEEVYEKTAYYIQRWKIRLVLYPLLKA
jgi:hypothetical protein